MGLNRGQRAGFRWRVGSRPLTLTRVRQPPAGAILINCYTAIMWLWVASAAVIVVVVGVIGALRRRGSDPGEGLTVSNGWIVEQRAKGESTHP